MQNFRGGPCRSFGYRCFFSLLCCAALGCSGDGGNDGPAGSGSAAGIGGSEEAAGGTSPTDGAVAGAGGSGETGGDAGGSGPGRTARDGATGVEGTTDGGGTPIVDRDGGSAVADAAAVDAAIDLDASLAADPCAIATRGTDDAPVTPVLGDAGPTPPSYCVPPCLWRAIVACTPPPAALCLQNRIDYLAPLYSDLRCDPDSGWFYRYTSPISTGGSVTFGHHGEVCFQVLFGGRALPYPMRSVSDGTKNVVTYSATLGTAVCANDQQTYLINPAAPECAPWTGADGTALVQPTFECSSTVDDPNIRDLSL